MTMIAPQTAALEAALQQAFVHHRAGRLSEAERLYRSILQARPDHPGVTNNLGLVLKDQGRLEEAAATFRRVLAVKPDDALAHCNLGNVLRLQGRSDQAAACYRGAIALQPDMALAHKNLGTVLCESDDLTESFASFKRHAELVYARPASSGRDGEPVPPHKAQHDREQQEYLNGGTAAAGQAGALAFHLEDGSRVPGHAVNPDDSPGDIATRWQNSKPQIAVIDNLVTDEALAKLRRFCWGSTIWRKVYRDGYLGAMPEHGFACPCWRKSPTSCAPPIRPFWAGTRCFSSGGSSTTAGSTASPSMPTLPPSTSTSGSPRTRPISIPQAGAWWFGTCPRRWVGTSRNTMMTFRQLGIFSPGSGPVR